MDTATLTRPSRPEPGTFYTSPTTGRTYFIREDGIAEILSDDESCDEGPTCSICDGLGHGYPGAGPCPLEDRGYDDGERY